jgi:hypothetical protein
MAQFQNESIRLSVTNILSDNDDSNTGNDTTNDMNQTLITKRVRQMSIDNINASRPRINSFPVPPLPRDETPDDEFFDAECKNICIFRDLMRESTERRKYPKGK